MHHMYFNIFYSFTYQIIINGIIWDVQAHFSYVDICQKKEGKEKGSWAEKRGGASKWDMSVQVQTPKLVSLGG